MNIKFIIPSLLFAFVLITSGCSKSAEDKLTGHAWVITSLKATQGTFSMDILALTDACIKDDQTTFNENGTATIDEGASKCNSTDPQTYDGGTWALSEDEKTLSLTSDGETVNWTLTKLETDLLEATASVVDPTDLSVTVITATWAKP